MLRGRPRRVGHRAGGGLVKGPRGGRPAAAREGGPMSTPGEITLVIRGRRLLVSERNHLYSGTTSGYSRDRIKPVQPESRERRTIVGPRIGSQSFEMQAGTETTSDPAAQGTPATDANRIPQDLPLPSPNDDPPTLLAKLTTVVTIVSDDRSIAAVTEE